MSHLFGICVGHSRFVTKSKRDGGAVSSGNIQEWNYNSEIASLLSARIKDLSDGDVRSKIYKDYGVAGYTTAIRNLSNRLKSDGVDAAIELHFNSFNGLAKGFEYLYYPASKNGLRLATCLRDSHLKKFPDAVARNGGLKANYNDRGEAFNSLPLCPSVICEPFFGDNPSEWGIYGTEEGKAILVDCYANAIVNYYSKS